MQIAKIENNQVVLVAHYKAMFPNVSFPDSGPAAEFLAENGCLPVEMWREHYPATERLEQSEPYIDNGVVYMVVVVQQTAEELAEKIRTAETVARHRRDELLAACDWTQIADSTANKEAWATYRQALRDITAQPGFPSSTEWPLAPGAPAAMTSV